MKELNLPRLRMVCWDLRISKNKFLEKVWAPELWAVEYNGPEVTNNPKLRELMFPKLAYVEDSVLIVNNGDGHPWSFEIPLQYHRAYGTTSGEVMHIEKNLGLTKVALPDLTVWYSKIVIQKNPDLEVIELPRLKYLGGRNIGRYGGPPDHREGKATTVIIKDNPRLASPNFPGLRQHLGTLEIAIECEEHKETINTQFSPTALTPPGILAEEFCDKSNTEKPKTSKKEKRKRKSKKGKGEKNQPRRLRATLFPPPLGGWPSAV
jgi:hypothetical protein